MAMVVVVACSTQPLQSGEPFMSGQGADGEARTYHRGCGTSEGFGYPTAPDIPPFHVGPIAFLGLSREYTSELHPPVSYKAAVVVDPKAVGTVSLRVAEEDWGVAALVYDPLRLDITEVTDGDTEVTFDNCEGAIPGYVGGFRIAEPACVVVRVGDERRDDDVEWTAAIPFGVPVEGCVVEQSE